MNLGFQDGEKFYTNWLLTSQGLSSVELGGLSCAIPNIIQPSLIKSSREPLAFFSWIKHAHIQLLLVLPFQVSSNKSTATVSRIKVNSYALQAPVSLNLHFPLTHLMKKRATICHQKKALTFVGVSYTRSRKCTIILCTSYSEDEATFIRQILFSQISLQPLK